MKDRSSYFLEYKRQRGQPGRSRFRRRTPLECRNLQAALRFYRDCGHTTAEMVKLVGNTYGGVTPSTINYYLNDPRCKAVERQVGKLLKQMPKTKEPPGSSSASER